METPLRDLPLAERPRERLAARGPACLSDEELLMILLGSGTRGHSVQQMAAELLPLLDTHHEGINCTELCTLAGMGAAKAAIILAALEFARRRIRPEGVKIRRADDILPLVQHLVDRTQEHFVCISLNGAHEVIKVRIITIGLANSAQVHPREVFCGAMRDRACAVIAAHNHPSGDLTPSNEDLLVTKQLCEAGRVLGIPLLDHLVFSKRGMRSCMGNLS